MSRAGLSRSARPARLLLIAALLASNAAYADRAAPAPDGPGRARPPGPADNRRIVGILDVRVEGVPDEVRDSFQRGLEDQLDTKQYWLASRALLKQRLTRSTKWTEGCLVGACLAEVRAQTGAELVLLAALTGSGTSFGYVVTLVRTDTGRVLHQDSERCDVCTVSEVLTKATLATIGLLNNVPDKLPDESAEQAASVASAVGKVNRDLVIERRHNHRVGGVVLGLGLAVAATGAILYALDNRREDWALPTALGGAGLAVGGITVLAF